MKRWFTTALLLMGGALPGWAHKYHASLTQIEHNRQADTLEVVVRVFADDLELAVSRASDKAWRLDSGDEAALWAYVKQKVVFAEGDKPLAWKPVGFENDVHQVWLYLELPLTVAPEKLSLSNTLFLELYRDQINTVNAGFGPQKTSFVYDLNRHRHDLNAGETQNPEP